MGGPGWAWVGLDGVSKAGATEDKVTINSLLYRDPPLESEQEVDDEEMDVEDVEVEPSDRAASPTDSVRGGGEVRASSPSYPGWLHEQLEARSPRPALPMAGEPPVQVGAEQVAPPPPPMVVAPPPVAPALRSSGRERKRKQIYGANGELDYKELCRRSTLFSAEAKQSPRGQTLLHTLYCLSVKRLE